MKMHSNRLILMIGILTFLLAACGGNGKSSDGIPLDEKGREDFGAFIDKFYSDINFQLERIEFPVEGKLKDDGIPELIFEENWTILRKVDDANPDYDVYNIVNADIATQKIIIKRSALIELGFNLYDNQWYLTRYSGISVSGAKSDRGQPAVDTTAVTNLEQDTLSK